MQVEELVWRFTGDASNLSKELDKSEERILKHIQTVQKMAAQVSGDEGIDALMGLMGKKKKKSAKDLGAEYAAKANTEADKMRKQGAQKAAKAMMDVDKESQEAQKQSRKQEMLGDAGDDALWNAEQKAREKKQKDSRKRQLSEEKVDSKQRGAAEEQARAQAKKEWAAGFESGPEGKKKQDKIDKDAQADADLWNAEQKQLEKTQKAAKNKAAQEAQKQDTEAKSKQKADTKKAASDAQKLKDEELSNAQKKVNRWNKEGENKDNEKQRNAQARLNYQFREQEKAAKKAQQEKDRLAKEDVQKKEKATREKARLEEQAVKDEERYQQQQEKIAKKNVLSIGEQTKAAAGVMAVLSAPIIGIGTASVAAFAEFDQAMTESQAIMDVTALQSDELKQKTLELGSKGKFGPAELAKAYYYLASSGYDVAESIKLLPVVAKFATAGVMDLEKATSLASDVISGLGLHTDNATQNLKEMQHVTDVLAKASTISNQTMQKFAEGLGGEVTGVLRQYGKGIEEAAAVLAVYASQKIKGSQAGGMFGRMLRLLSNEAARNSFEFRRLGISVYDSNGDMRNFADIIEDLEKKFATLSDKGKAASAHMLGFDYRTQRAILPLIGMSKKIREYQTALENAGGTTDKMANKQLQSFNNQLKILKNQLDAVFITIGEEIAPAILLLADAGKMGLSFWQGLPKYVRASVVAFAAVSAGIMGVTASIILAGVAFNTFFGGIGLITGLIVTGVAAYAGIAGAIMAIFGGIADAVLDIRKHAAAAWEWLIPVRKAAWDLLKAMMLLGKLTMEGIGKTLSLAFKIAVNDTGMNMAVLRDTLRDTLIFAEYAVLNLEQTWSYAWISMQLEFIEVADTVSHFFIKQLPFYIVYFGDIVGDILTEIRKNFGTVFMEVTGFIMTAFAVTLKWLVENFQTTFFGINLLIADTIGNIARVLSNLPALIKGSVKMEDLWKPIGDGFKFQLSEFPDLAKAAMNRIGKEIDFKAIGENIPDVPEREMGKLEKQLRMEFQALGGKLGMDFDKFRRMRLRQMAIGSPEEEALAEKKGQDIGRNITKGFREGMKFDQAMYASAEAIGRIVEYVDKTLRPELYKGKHGGEEEVKRFNAADFGRGEAKTREEQQLELLKQIAMNTGKAANKAQVDLDNANLGN